MECRYIRYSNQEQEVEGTHSHRQMINILACTKQELKLGNFFSGNLNVLSHYFHKFLGMKYNNQG